MSSAPSMRIHRAPMTTSISETAAKLGRVLVANDKDQLLIALRWIEEARPFRGYVVWRQKLIDRFPVSAFLDAFDALAAQDDPFRSYPIVHSSQSLDPPRPSGLGLFCCCAPEQHRRHRPRRR
jgi:hypothetical protein